jgi:PTH1 family peptidyl-tRNA hydrolase
MNKFLIVGLGNIGAEYAHTRHNIGFDIADAWVSKQEAAWRIDRLGEVAEVKLKGRQVTLLKPATYMNLSGRAVAYWLQQLKLSPEQMLVMADELALPIEKIRLRPSGSHAGHNGLRHIHEVLGTDAYPRLRFGIGNHYPKGRQADYVLSPWTEAEKPVVARKIETCCELVTSFVLEGITVAMNRYNNVIFNGL